MFEFLTKSDGDAIVIIKKDHDKVKVLFDQFENADTLRQKKKIAAEAIMELKIHTSIEEEIFYPAVRHPIGKKIMNEADEEHHVAKLLIAELEEMDGSEDHYEAKFKVLSENVRHHIKEEENDMLPEARKLTIDFEGLGKQLLLRKDQLLKKGVAIFAEEKMISRNKGKGDSPAVNAKRTKPLLVKPSLKNAVSTKATAKSKTAAKSGKTPAKKSIRSKRG